MLPKPKRSIRWLIVNECYGMVGFYSVKAELAKRGIVGLYLDTVGDRCRPDYPIILHRTGAAVPTYANALVKLVLDRLPEPYKGDLSLGVRERDSHGGQHDQRPDGRHRQPVDGPRPRVQGVALQR